MELEWNGDEVLAVLKTASLEGLELAGEHLLQVSSGLAPHEEGDLERSGEVSSDPEEVAVAVSFNRVYAVKQHEDLTLEHDEGRQAKYLESPMHTEKDVMLALVAQAGRRPFR